MVKEFSLLGFIAHLPVMALEVEHENHKALERCGNIIATRARGVLGTYDYAWPQLAQSTQNQRESLGYEPNDPGLRDGAMRDSIGYTADHHKVDIGSNDKHLVWFEHGTSRQPPRPVLQGALIEKMPEVLKEIGTAVAAGLTGEKVAGPNSPLPGASRMADQAKAPPPRPARRR